MSEILLTLVKYIWVLDFTALCVFFVLYLKSGQISSSLLTLVVAVVISRIVNQYEFLVFAIQGPSEGSGYLMAWCIGFAIADLILAFSFYKMYTSFKKRFGGKARLLIIFLVSTFMIALINIQYGPLLFDNDDPTHKLWIRVAFYLGNVVLYTIATYAIHKLHERNKVSYSVIARMYIIAFFAATHLQIFRFLERLTWDTNYLEPIYRWGFVSINSCTTALTLLVATLAIYNHYSKSKREGTLWNI
jgi:hypothetical protein